MDTKFWTDERVTLLRERFALGWTTRQIGRSAEFGCGHNAVISKLHRIGLRRRSRTQAATDTDLLQRLTKPKKAKTPRAKQVRVQSYGSGLRLVETPAPMAADLEPETSATAVNFMQLEPHHCRWPVEGEGAAMLCCGADKLDGFSYCARHARMAYTPARSRTQTFHHGRTFGKRAA